MFIVVDLCVLGTSEDRRKANVLLYTLAGRFVTRVVYDTLIFYDDNLYLTLMFLDDLVREQYFGNIKMKILV